MATGLDGDASRQALVWRIVGNRKLRDFIAARGLLIVLASAVVLRITWAVLQSRRGYHHAAGEAYNVALAISNGRGIADAYYVGQGATAHVTPFTPAIAGGAYNLLGNASPAAEATLTVWAIGLVVAAYWLWYRSFAYLGVPKVVRLLALTFLAVMPVYITLEAVDFRVWDGALVSLTAAGLFNLILRADRTGSMETWNLSAIAILLSVLLFLNPNIGVAAGVATVVLMVRRFDIRQTVMLVSISGLALVVIVAPWTMRNQRELGASVMLRSNAGIELAIANYKGALNAGDPAALYRDRLAQIHPFSSARATEIMKRTGGEVIYSRHLGDETVAWIILHPYQFARLYVTHVLEVFFPQTWQFSLFGGGALQSSIRSYLCALLSVGSFLSIAAAYRRRDIIWLYPACFLLIPALIYGIFQPVPRYTYLIYGVSTLMAADGFFNLIRQLRGLPPSTARAQVEAI